MSAPSPRRVVVVSFLVDLLDVVTNLTVAIFTGSAVVFAEMAQGLADAIGSALLVVGDRCAARPPDARHPLGHAREAFFWGLLSAVAMLVVGAGLSAWRGYQQLVAPEPVEHSGLAIAVLVLAIGTNGYAVSLSVRNLSNAGRGLRATLLGVDRPLVKSALLRDVVGTTTSVIGLVAILATRLLGSVAFDAAGALAAAGMMSFASVALLWQARELITGRSLPPAELVRLKEAVLAASGVVGVNRLTAIHSGATRVRVDLDLDLAEELDTPRIEVLLDDVEHRVRRALPETGRVHVELNSLPPKG